MGRKHRVNFFYRRSTKIALLLPTTLAAVGVTIIQIVFLARGYFVSGEDYLKQPLDSVVGIILSLAVCFVCIVALVQLLRSGATTNKKGSPAHHHH
jgi:hypothetical protein